MPELPLEPTKEMIQAAIDRDHDPNELIYVTIWKAMVKAHLDENISSL